MTSTIEKTDIELIFNEEFDPEKTCELIRMSGGRCSRPAYVSAQLAKPCGHYNASFLICRPCWNDVLAGNVMGLRCGRCKEPFDIKSCIVSWDLL